MLWKILYNPYNMLPLKKIYVDSRHRTPDSLSDNNFKIELPYTLQLPDNCVFFVTDVCIPHVWRTIEENVNDRLYLRYKSIELVGAQPTTKHAVIQLPSGNYTGANLATAVQQALNTRTLGMTWSVAYDDTQYSIAIACTGNPSNYNFKFFTDAEIAAVGNSVTWEGGMGVDPNNPMSANDLLKITIPKSDSQLLTTDFVNLQSINNVYITSPNLGSFDTIAPFSNNIIKKVPVTAGYGFMIVDQIMSTNDYLNCSRQTLKTIEFHIRDGRGRYVNLHGMHVTFSIVFNKYNLEI